MNEHLAKALKELEDANAANIPKTEEVTSASDGTEWSGEIKDGGDWKLIKNSTDSYTNNTRRYN